MQTKFACLQKKLYLCSLNTACMCIREDFELDF